MNYQEACQEAKSFDSVMSSPEGKRLFKGMRVEVSTGRGNFNKNTRCKVVVSWPRKDGRDEHHLSSIRAVDDFRTALYAILCAQKYGKQV